jgi:hypothetical protein
MREIRPTVKVGQKLAAALLVSLLLSTPGVTRAQAPDFGLRLGLGDYDQKWWSSEYLDGKSHCVPTTYLDILYFLHNKGLTQLEAWAPVSSDRELIRHRVFQLGDSDHLDTDPESGTDAEDAFYYMTDFIADRSSNILLFHFFYGPDFDWGTGTLAKLHYNGAIMAIGYGRYFRVGTGIDTYWSRSGGHYMAFAGYDYSSTPKSCSRGIQPMATATSIGSPISTRTCAKRRTSHSPTAPTRCASMPSILSTRARSVNNGKSSIKCMACSRLTVDGTISRPAARRQALTA